MHRQATAHSRCRTCHFVQLKVNWKINCFKSRWSTCPQCPIPGNATAISESLKKDTVYRVFQKKMNLDLIFSVNFWATVCKTVRPMLSDRCVSVCLWRSCTVANLDRSFLDNSSGRVIDLESLITSVWVIEVNNSSGRLIDVDNYSVINWWFSASVPVRLPSPTWYRTHPE